MNTLKCTTIITLAVVALTTTSCKKESSTTEPAKAEAKTEVAAKSTQLQVEFDTLKGKWLRPDGGYVIELSELLPENKVTAAYFNPRPINVGEAKIFTENGFTKVFIKLQDQNYEGATYDLIYDKENDQLRGIYSRPPPGGEQYQIFFTRMPKE